MNSVGRVLVIGATSGIARATMHVLAAQGSDLVLAGRAAAALEREAADLRIRYGVATRALVLDVLQPDLAALDLHLDVDGVLLCVGELGDQAASQASPDALQRTVDINFTGSAAVLERAAAVFEARGSGWICAVGSVAGDRGRASNYIYGSAKAGLAAYISGLRQRLHRHGVSVTLVKPGFVDTPMTEGREGMFLVASPDRVAKDIVRAVRRGKATIYSPWFWRPILWVLRLVPEALFKRLSL